MTGTAMARECKTLLFFEAVTAALKGTDKKKRLEGQKLFRATPWQFACAVAQRAGGAESRDAAGSPGVVQAQEHDAAGNPAQGGARPAGLCRVQAQGRRGESEVIRVLLVQNALSHPP